MPCILGKLGGRAKPKFPSPPLESGPSTTRTPTLGFLDDWMIGRHGPG